MKKFFLFTLLIFNVLTFAWAGDGGYKIKIKLTDYSRDTLLLGFQMGNQTFLKDTAILDKKTNYYVFEGTEKLKGGVYLIVTPPENDYFQIIVADSDLNLELTCAVADPYQTFKLNNAPDNQLFFGYMRFIAERRKIAEEARRDSTNKEKIKATMERLDKEVKQYQADLIAKNPKSVTALLIRSTIEITPPEYPKDSLRDLRLYHYFREHYFDNFQLNNDAMLRIPTTFQRLTYYVEKLTPQHPDSITQTLDDLFERMKPSQEMFRYYYVHFLNNYIKAKIVGFDAIYVHLTKKYLESGFAPFIGKEDSAKLVEQANKRFNILIGKQAPDVRMFRPDNSTVNLHGVKSKYTIFYVWDPDCGHCKKSMPALIEFYQKWKSQGVEVFCVCSKPPSETQKCVDAIKNGFSDGTNTIKLPQDWINATDPYMISRYKTLYNVEVTPAVFVLDKDKKIISKELESKQLDALFENLKEEEKKK